VWSEALSATDVPGVVIAIMRRVEGFVLRRAACVIAISDAVAEQVSKFDVPADRLRVVANGVDTSVFNPQGEAAVSERPYFAYTGTISEWQGADVFVRALPIVQRKCPDAEIRFFGQGTDEPALRALAAQIAPGSVVFGGVVPPRQAAAWLRGAAAALVSIKPDQGYDFAKPTKIYAAAGCGTRVIFAGAGEGAAVVADNGLGDAVDHDPHAVAAAMIAALEGEESGRGVRSQWVADHASLAAAGQAAAAIVATVARTSR
jgi:glycosyltransferase involved in cell wall biosynthesis